MIDLVVEIPEKLENMANDLAEIQRRAANRAGFAASMVAGKELARLIPAKHPMAQLFEKTEAGRWQKHSKPSPRPFSSLEKFARHIVYGRGSAVRLGFGYFAGRVANPKFDSTLMGAARRVTEGKTTQVTDKMRRKMAATKGIIGTVAGKSFFPLKKTTTTLKLKPRKMNTAETERAMWFVFKTQYEKFFSEAYGE